METALEKAWFGSVPGADGIEYGFHKLIAPAAPIRALMACTVIGSGTGSLTAHATVGSDCITKRRAIERIADSAPATPFLIFDGRVRTPADDCTGGSLLGTIDLRIVEGCYLKAAADNGTPAVLVSVAHED
ncbi:MAG: hypothetical protein PGN09_00340 [Sphingomonas fennica]